MKVIQVTALLISAVVYSPETSVVVSVAANGSDNQGVIAKHGRKFVGALVGGTAATATAQQQGLLQTLSAGVEIFIPSSSMHPCISHPNPREVSVCPIVNSTDKGKVFCTSKEDAKKCQEHFDTERLCVDNAVYAYFLIEEKHCLPKGEECSEHQDIPDLIRDCATTTSMPTTTEKKGWLDRIFGRSPNNNEASFYY